MPRSGFLQDKPLGSTGSRLPGAALKAMLDWRESSGRHHLSTILNRRLKVDPSPSSVFTFSSWVNGIFNPATCLKVTCPAQLSAL
jgi:hypothetical protein